MEEKSNNHLWTNFVQVQRQVEKSLYKIRQLSIAEQTALLAKAFEQKQEREALMYMLEAESIDFNLSKRELSKNLIDQLIDVAIMLDRNTKDAMDLLLAIVKYFPDYEKKIRISMIKYLNEADETDDYEVYQRVGYFLNKVNSPYNAIFLGRCSNHHCSDINKVVEL